MSTTLKIKKELIRLVNLEEYSAGLTVKEAWKQLEKTDFAKELYNSKGQRRDGTLVGLTTRIKSGKVEGLKVVKNSDYRIVYVADGNELDYLSNLTNKFLSEADNFKVKAEDYSKEQQKILEEYSKALTQLKNSTVKLKKVADEVEVKKLKTETATAIEQKDKKAVDNIKEKPTTTKTELKKANTETSKKVTSTAKK